MENIVVPQVMIQLGDRYKNSVQVVVEGLYDVIEEIVKMLNPLNVELISL